MAEPGFWSLALLLPGHAEFLVVACVQTARLSRLQNALAGHGVISCKPGLRGSASISHLHMTLSWLWKLLEIKTLGGKIFIFMSFISGILANTNGHLASTCWLDSEGTENYSFISFSKGRERNIELSAISWHILKLVGLCQEVTKGVLKSLRILVTEVRCFLSEIHCRNIALAWFCSCLCKPLTLPAP